MSPAPVFLNRTLLRSATLSSRAPLSLASALSRPLGRSFAALPPPTGTKPVITPVSASSTLPTSSSASATASPSVSSSSRAASDTLNWEQYLQKRRSKKWLETLCALPTTFTGMTIGVSYFANTELDPTASIAGFEPVYVYMAATFASAFGGFLLGTPLGGFIWRVYNRRYASAIERMDRKFFDHIAKHRADPTIQSVNAAAHPIPDYYGEKIYSLSGYRKWLRAQAKYKRKAHVDQVV
ncbi:Mitochondrial import protein Pam17 [Phaffia rhodozyma]|uniref:Presequence translocated-associated motor subunit PAM17 n=1 Tax=Phaffia rhodozyma TaxID=264483 RepID=A0A0F7SU31_PHARH|nr:Mitochondrial import protein Pam17 [Phaffia rhodozyma]